MGPQTRQARQHVLVVGQLHLRLGIGRPRPRHEDVENQARAVEHAAGHGLLDVTGLRGRQFVVEDHHVDLLVAAVVGDLLQLARPHVDARRGLGQPLREALHGGDVGRFGQKLQFVEVLGSLPRVLVVAHHGHGHGTLAPRFAPDVLRCVVLVFQIVFLSCKRGYPRKKDTLANRFRVR